MMTQNPLGNGRFASDYARYVLALAALIAAAVTGGGPEYAAALFSFGDRLLPPLGGSGPDRLAT
ncbi:hypothetical protein [Streptomyces asiaticus]|uniref:hypothetical protein n=1 Tax=Streptomyces asiaticus TaxID=114695 RepID=UPI0037F66214